MHDERRRPHETLPAGVERPGTRPPVVTTVALARWLALPIAVVFALDLLATRLDWAALGAIAAAVDPTGQGNLAAWLLALPGLAVLLSAVALGRVARGSVPSLCLGVLGASTALLGIADAIGVSGGSTPARVLEAGLLLSLLAVSLVVCRSVRGRLCLLAALALLLSNPLTERLELRLVTNGANYTFVSWSEPYRFNEHAWRQLWLVTRAQELSEALAMLLVLLALEGAVAAAASPADAEQRAVPREAG